MKTELKAKLLQHLAGKKRDGGFTLIELLVVIIIIGILAAIALPSFLNQANKAKESEAKQYVGAANRGQQAYFLQANQFTTAFSRIELGLSGAAQGTGIETTNFTYTMPSADVKQTVGILAATRNTNTLRSYVGGVQTGLSGSGEATTVAILCGADKPSFAAVQPTFAPGTANAPTCPANFQTLNN